MENKKVSFLGDLIIIIIIVLFVFLFMWQFKQNTVKEIISVNEEFGVSKELLVPYNTNEYILRLSKIKDTEATAIIIDFVKLNQEISEVDKLLFRASVVREDCISRDLKLKINSIDTKIDKLLFDFEKINTKKYESLNIDSYVLFLKNTKQTYFTYRIDVEKLTVCR